MPEDVGRLILESLHRDALGRDRKITVTRTQVVEGLLDHRCLASLPLPPGEPAEYPPLVARSPFEAARPMFDQLRTGDVLAHHPIDAFDDTVVRFFTEAAHDPQVTAIGATLYRVGNPSPIVDALLHAARAGVPVFVFAELQARFDEAHNVHWVRALERADGRVVYGVPGLKVLAKVALVDRREGNVVRAYAHVGTGNYNPRSGRQYTDLSLFSAREPFTLDVRALLGMLAEHADPTTVSLRDGLMAPVQLPPGVLQRIAREVRHAEAGRPARITIKVNGLADTEVVRALEDAARRGVQIALIVRGICTLRPDASGTGARIRIVSTVGRWLEHSRFYRFENAGAPEYFIGSADLRPRNLRRCVELLVPVPEASHQRLLDALLARHLTDPAAWVGSYVRCDGAASA